MAPNDNRTKAQIQKGCKDEHDTRFLDRNELIEAMINLKNLRDQPRTFQCRSTIIKTGE
jgi:hypothetical protein